MEWPSNLKIMDKRLGLHVCSVWQKEDATINEAINLLDQRIRHGDRGVPENPISIMVEYAWHEGQSLPVRPAAQKKVKTKPV